jgi:hypothetical protein
MFRAVKTVTLFKLEFQKPNRYSAIPTTNRFVSVPVQHLNGRTSSRTDARNYHTPRQQQQQQQQKFRSLLNHNKFPTII